jgi:hypothetical protein
MKTPVNSAVLPTKGVKKLAGFSFQNEEKSRKFFYKYGMNFPKFFLRAIVEN